MIPEITYVADHAAVESYDGLCRMLAYVQKGFQRDQRPAFNQAQKTHGQAVRRIPVFNDQHVVPGTISYYIYRAEQEVINASYSIIMPDFYPGTQEESFNNARRALETLAANLGILKPIITIRE